MDELAANSQQFDFNSLLVMQGAMPTADYTTRSHLRMAIKMVYQMQSEEENWSRWGDVIKKAYHKVSAKSYNNITERMSQNLFGQAPVGMDMFKVFSHIDFEKFRPFYTEHQWATLLFNLNLIGDYYIENKPNIAKRMDDKFKFFVRPHSTFG